jgi:GTP-binding protein
VAEGVEFVDECTVHVRGGRGGDGAVSIRREKHVPRGGPDGGDGGDGGDVVLLADNDTTSLLDLHRAPHRRAGDGKRGEGNNRTGASGSDLVIRVPIGTVVKDRDTGDVYVDLAVAGQRAVVAEGGRGGRGNASFATRNRRVPRFAESGERSEELLLRLELKLIADVGLVGFPSAGKSSLVRALSAATPRVEAWPFTTLTPHLGVLRAGVDGDHTDVIIADVPGLVEGAADGKGLGHQFLRHIERCHVLLHVLDAAPFDPDRDPVHDLEVLREELRRYEPGLLERPQVVVLNKVDLPDGQAMAELMADGLAGEEVLEVSALTGGGLDPLRYRLAELVRAARPEPGEVEAEAAHVVLRPLQVVDDLRVQLLDRAYHVHGERVQRWVRMLDTTNSEATRFLQGRLKRAGVEKLLIAAGARTGDEVVIDDLVFEFDPDPRDLPDEERAALLAAELAAELGEDVPEPDDADWDDTDDVPDDEVEGDA